MRCKAFFNIGNIAMALIVVGAVMLCVSFFCGWTESNIALLLPLAFILIGVILYVVSLTKSKKTHY